MARVVDLICPTAKAKYFSQRGWTVICPSGTFSSLRGATATKQSTFLAAHAPRPGHDGLEQRRHLPHLQRPQEHRAVDKTQRKRPRFFAFQHRLLAERVDAGGDA